jgi:hypothetical protein
MARPVCISMPSAPRHSGRALDMSSVASEPKTQTPSRLGRIVASLPFFALAALLGNVASRVLWQRYGGPFFGSFGFVLNFGFFRLHEPASSWFVLIGCACLIWGGCSVLRRRRRLPFGAVAGGTWFIIFIVAFLAAA